MSAKSDPRYDVTPAHGEYYILSEYDISSSGSMAGGILCYSDRVAIDVRL